MSIQDIKSELRRVRAEMKQRGIRTISCFNAGLTSDERHYNTLLFNLKTDLITHEKQAQAQMSQGKIN